MVDESSLFYLIGNCLFQLWITSLVQHNTREEIVYKTQEQGLVFIDLKERWEQNPRSNYSLRKPWTALLLQ